MLYIILGLITATAVTAACAGVMETVAHQVIEITQHGYEDYLATQEFRYAYAQSRYIRSRPTVCMGM